MALKNRIAAAVAGWRSQGQRSVRADGGGLNFAGLDDPRLVEYLRGGSVTHSGAVVNESTALKVATAWRCANIICGVLATLPADLMLRENENARSPAVNHPFRDVLTVRPNPVQTPGEFKKMLQLHKLQVGNGFALIVRSRGYVVALWPLDPMRMKVCENADKSLTYKYTARNGGQIEFDSTQILHLRGLSWDGITGLPVIRYMAESIGVAMQAQRAAATLFKNGQFTPGYFETANALTDKAYDRLKVSIDENSGVDADRAFKALVLEEGLKFAPGAVTAQQAELVDTMGVSRSDIGAFYGVPPHLYGDTDKSTSWGTGIEQQNLGFLQYTIQEHLQAWSEVLKRDCLSGKNDDPRLYVHFDLKGFLRADAAGRSAYLSRALGSGGGRPWMTQNEGRAAEDMPPRKEAWADQLPEIGAGRITENIATASPAGANPSDPPEGIAK